MIMAERTLPAGVRRAYQMLALIQANLEEVEQRPAADQSPVHEKTYQKYYRGFYTAREALVEAVHDEKSVDDTQCVRNALTAAGVPHIPIESVRFYYDMQPFTQADMKCWWLHVFYGGKRRPMGWYHGHIIVKVTSDGAVVSLKRHRRPGASAARSRSKL